MTICIRCDAEFEPTYDGEIACWLCVFYWLYNEAVQYDYLESKYAPDVDLVGTTATNEYWGESTDTEDYIPF